MVVRPRSRTTRWLGCGVVTLAVAASLTGAGTAGATDPEVSRDPAGIWAASLEGVHGVSPDATVRQIARVSVAASGIRVRFGNPFGSAAVHIRDAWAGRTLAPGTARLVPGSNRPLTFRGARGVVIPPGQEVLSDPAP